MPDVVVWILHPEAAPTAGPIGRAVAGARAALAERHRAAFGRAGATAVRIVSGPSDDTPFGARLRALVAEERPAGIVVLGSGAIPLATVADRQAFLAAAAADRPVALANNRYSADVVAISQAERLLDLPDLATDNGLPRWLAEEAGYDVTDVRGRWRLALDVDGPIDLVLLGSRWSNRLPDTDLVRERLAGVAAAIRDAQAEILIAGRTSPAALALLEQQGNARTRALIEERGMRSAAPGINRRPPASVLGLLLDRDGPEALGGHLARLGDAALVDTRVLLAHRLGTDERGWPSAEDRFASDLLLPDRIDDPWLRGLTEAARTAPLPVVLGGHSLVGPGIRLLVRGTPWS